MNPASLENDHSAGSRKERIRRAVEQELAATSPAACESSGGSPRNNAGGGGGGGGGGSVLNAAVALTKLGDSPGAEEGAKSPAQQQPGDGQDQMQKGKGNDGAGTPRKLSPSTEQDSKMDDVSCSQQQQLTAPEARPGSPEMAGETQKTFPEILMEILSDPSNERAVSWLPHGRCFRIHKREQFLQEVLPKHYGKSQGGTGGVIKYTSFTRKLSRWEFVRLSSGPDIGSFYHKLFRRDNPQLCKKMICKGERPKFVRSNILGGPHCIGMNHMNSYPMAGTSGVSQAHHASLQKLQAAQRSALALSMQAQGSLNPGLPNNMSTDMGLGTHVPQDQQNMANVNDVGMLQDHFAVNRLLKYKLELEMAIAEKKRDVATAAARLEQQQQQQQAHQTMSASLRDQQLQNTFDNSGGSGGNMLALDGRKMCATPNMGTVPSCSQQQQQQQASSCPEMNSKHFIQQNLSPNALLSSTNTMPCRGISDSAVPQKVGDMKSSEDILQATRRALFQSNMRDTRDQQGQNSLSSSTSSAQQDIDSATRAMSLAGSDTMTPSLDLRNLQGLSNADKHRFLMAQQKQLELEQYAATNTQQEAGTQFALKHAQERVAALRKQAMQRQQQAAMTQGLSGQGGQPSQGMAMAGGGSNNGTDDVLDAARRALHRNNALDAHQEQQAQGAAAAASLPSSAQQDVNANADSMQMTSTGATPTLDLRSLQGMSDADKHCLLMAQQKQLELEQHAAANMQRGSTAGTQFALKHAQERVAELRRQALQRQQQAAAALQGHSGQGGEGSIDAAMASGGSTSGTEGVLDAARQALHRNNTLDAHQDHRAQGSAAAMPVSSQQDVKLPSGSMPMAGTGTTSNQDMRSLQGMSDVDRHCFLVAQQKQLELEEHAASSMQQDSASGAEFALKHAQERVAALRRQALQRQQQVAAPQAGQGQGGEESKDNANDPNSRRNPDGKTTLAQAIMRAYAA